MLDPQWMAKEPWPLTDLSMRGNDGRDYDGFRFMVWRSLLGYFERRLVYDYFDGFRLVEINFERDPEYKSIRQMKDLDLLVLVTGMHEPPNSYAPHLVEYVKSLRKMDGRPTWIYRVVTVDSAPKTTTAVIVKPSRAAIDGPVPAREDR